MGNYKDPVPRQEDDCSQELQKTQGILKNCKITGNVSVISTNPPCKDGNVRFTKRYPSKPRLMKYDLEINIYNFEN